MSQKWGDRVFAPSRAIPDKLPQTAAVGFFVLVFLGLLGWTGYGIVSQPRYRLIWCCELPLIAVALLPPLIRALRRELDVLSPALIFTLYLFCQEGLWTAYLLTTGQAHMHSTVDSYLGTLPQVLLYTSLALLCFQFPWFLRWRPQPLPPRHWHRQRLQQMALLLPVIAMVAFMMFLTRVGGLGSYLSDLGSNRVVELNGLWGFIMASEATITAGCCCAAVLGWLGRNKLWYWYADAMMVAGVLIGLMVGYRIVSVIPLLTLLAVRHYLGQRIQLNAKTLAAALVLVVLSSVYSNLRDRPELARQEGWYPVVSALTDVSGYQTGLTALMQRLQGSETFAVVIADTSRNGGYQWGWRAAVQAPALLIPRAVWPSSPFKTDPESIRFGTLFFGSAWDTLSRIGGISPTWMGELYWNFGVLGDLGAALLLGWFTRRIYLRALHPRSGYSILLLAYLPIMVVLLAEAPSDALTGVTLAILPMLCIRNWVCPAVPPAVQWQTAPTSGWPSTLVTPIGSGHV